MPQRISTQPMSDFQGGLNLNADPFQLGPNETASCLNVDFDPLGGFARRDGTARLNSTALTSTIKNMWGHYTPNGSTRQLICQQGQSIAYSTNDGTAFTQVGTGSAPWSTAYTGTMQGASFRDPTSLGNVVCYITRGGTAVPIRWNGSTGTALTDPSVTPSWSETIGTRTNGRMPKAEFILTHRDFVWVANTYETSGGSEKNHPNRVRWSHEGFPEDWRSSDYIDIESGAGDSITGIASWRDGLLVFKSNSVFLIRGYDADTFEVVNLSRSIGAVSQQAIAVTEAGVYFFSWPEGVYFYDGTGIHDVFQPMRPIVEDGTVDRTQRATITMGWLKQRLWVSLPCDVGITGNTDVYVLDPALRSRNKQGGWTHYQFGDVSLGAGLGVMLDYAPPATDPKWLTCSYSQGRTKIIALHQTGDTDNLTGTGEPILTEYTTPWVDVGNPAVVKSWRRPVFVYRKDEDYQLTCTTYRDYDNTNVGGTFYLNSTTNSGTALVWDVGKWDEKQWALGVGLPQGITRGSRLGRATAVALKIVGPTTTTVKWGVNSITWKYIPKRVRS
jgi:hypothetical protein